MAVSNIIEPFVWGRGGAKMTPEQIARQRDIAEALASQGNPAFNNAGWLGALGRGLEGAYAGWSENKANQAETANATASEQRIADMLAATGPQQFPAAPTATGGGSSDYANQRVSQAFGDTNASADQIKAGLVARGLPEHIADGFVMNFQDESGLNPGINEKAPLVPGSRGGYGLYQLTGPRRVAYEKFAAERGVEPSSVDAQLDFLMSELQGPEAKAAQSIMAAPDAGTAAAAIAKNFLRPAKNHLDSRVSRYLSSAGQPAQVASLDPSIGLPETAPIPTPGPENVPIADGKGDRVTMADAAPVPMQPGPLSSDPRHVAFMGRMTDPQPMGGVPMPMQGAAAAPSGQEQVAQALAGPDLSRIPVAAGGDAGVYQPGQPMGVNPAMVQALASPYASDQEKQIAGLLLKQQLEQQAQAADPMRALDMDYKRAQIGKLQREASGPAELGLNPQYGVDAQGNPVLIQIGKDGKAIQTAMPDGVTLSKEPIKMDAGTHFVLLDPITRQPVGTIPKENYQEAFEKGAGTNAAKAQAEAAAGLPAVEDNANSILGMIDSLSNDKYLDSMVGPVRSRIPNLSGDAARVQSKMDQITGQAFLQAFNTLRGGGQISNVEGEKATAAIARLNTAQNPKDYRDALQELRDIVQRGVDRARQQAGASGGGSDYKSKYGLE